MASTEDQEPIEERLRRLEVLSSALLNVIFGGDEKSLTNVYDLLRNLPYEVNILGSVRPLERQLAHGLNRPVLRRALFAEDLLELTRRISAVGEESQETTRRVGQLAQSIEKDIKSLGRKTESVQVEVHTLLAIQALGVSPDCIKLTRFVPVRVYIDETPDGAVAELTSAVTGLLNAYGFEISDEFPAVRGSWFQKMFAKSKDVLTQPEVVKRLEKIERAVEIAKISKPQAEADEKQANAISKLIKALERTRNGAVQAGSVLVVKTTPAKGSPVIMARTLTQSEMIALENNQVLLQNPGELLGKLSEACAAAKMPSQSYCSPSSLGGYEVPAVPLLKTDDLTGK
jgi:hypothetical protein